MGIESWKLTEFNLGERQIKLGSKLGLVKIIRSDDGTLVLIGDASYGIIDQEKPSPASFAKPDSILGFVMDIGIQKEKMLSRGHGFYFGIPLIHPQSQRVVTQKNFDESLFEKIGSLINAKYQSGDKRAEMEAIQLQLLFDAYNNARLLFPNFYAESYLSLMRIIDAVSATQGSYDFAVFVATLSSDQNKAIFSKLDAVYKDRIKIALELFDNCLQKANKKKWACYGTMVNFDDAQKTIFSCFYSAYQYRNKFVHMGFPFPDTVKNSIGLEADAGTAYLYPALGMSWFKVHRPDGLQDGDLIDIHEVVKDEEEVRNFKTKYFQLLPTWHFLKLVTRSALLEQVK